MLIYKSIRKEVTTEVDIINIKEKISRLKCIMDRVKYRREKHFYLTVFGLPIFIVVVFSIIFVNQRMDIKRKENILESYYLSAESVNSYKGYGFDAKSDCYDSEGSNNCNIGDDYSNYYNDNWKINSSEEDNYNSSYSEDSKDYTDFIKVYICGQVLNPDVYEVEKGARIVDIIDLAGGVTEEACLEIINLAEAVADGQRVYIPSQEEIERSGALFFSGDSSFYGSTDNTFSVNKTVNINYAGRKELESLPGIGPITAQSIIDYRTKRGLFKSKEELKNVKGIGEKKYEKIKDVICI